MTDHYIARQPILDVQGNTFGYELLFRSTHNNTFDPATDGDSATASVLINSVADAGLASIVGDSLAFINITQKFLEYPEMLDLLDPGTCVLEVLEHVDVTDAVVLGVTKLRAKGHTIALDDYVDVDRFVRLMPLVQIIKYDITQHSMTELAAFRLRDEAAGRFSLAERVETRQEFEFLEAAGFQYFQGFFFAQPCVIRGKRLPQSRIAVLRLMEKVNDPEATINELAEVIGQDVSMSLRTLRYVNSPLSELNSEVTSIFHAVVMMGSEPIRNWLMLMMVAGLDDRPVELGKMALTRARFCQLLAKEKGLPDVEMYFTIGLLSLLGSMVDAELSVVLDEVSISNHIREQLLAGKGEGGEMLRLLSKLEAAHTIVGDDASVIGPIYQRSIAWSEETMGLL